MQDGVLDKAVKGELSVEELVGYGAIFSQARNSLVASQLGQTAFYKYMGEAGAATDPVMWCQIASLLRHGSTIGHQDIAIVALQRSLELDPACIPVWESLHDLVHELRDEFTPSQSEMFRAWSTRMLEQSPTQGISSWLKVQGQGVRSSNKRQPEDRSRFPYGCGTCFGDPECQHQAVEMCIVCEQRGLCQMHLDRRIGGSKYHLNCPECRPYTLKGGAGDEEEEAMEEDEVVGTDWAPFITEYPSVSTPGQIEAADDRDWAQLGELFKPLVDKGILTMRQFFAPDEPGVGNRDPADVLEQEYICKLPPLQELMGKTLLLVSETSTRKSFRIREFIQEQCQGKNIIFVSSRCSHAGDAFTQLKDMGFAVYNAKGEGHREQVVNDGTTRMIVQV